MEAIFSCNNDKDIQKIKLAYYSLT